MSCYFISIGGSGAKILEALTHLTALGVLPGEEPLNVIALDPDTGNGNLERTYTTLKSFEGFQDVKVGYGTVLFKNKLQIANPFPFNPVPAVGANLDHNKLMDENVIAGKPLGQLYKVLYSKRERQTPLNKGFLGHPSIGAAVMTRTVPTSPLWNSLNGQINTEIGVAKPVKVFLAGSIFGGTGAAGIPTIARLLKNTFHGGISIGGVFLLPYFSFNAAGKIDEKELFAKSENFLINSKAALKYYAQGQNDFDYMYFLGDNSIVNNDFSIGGQTQRNNAHIIDLYGALSAVDFFANAKPLANTQYNYICRENDNEFKWKDFQNLAPNFKKLFIQFSRFILAYVQYIKPTLDAPPDVKDWIAAIFNPIPSWYLSIAYPEKDFDNNTLTPDVGKINEFNKYAVNYCTWLKQIETSLPTGRTVSLINPNVFNVVFDAKGQSKIFVNAGDFKWLDPTELQGGLTLDDIYNKLSNVDGKAPGQGFGKLLRHVYDSCTV